MNTTAPTTGSSSRFIRVPSIQRQVAFFVTVAKFNGGGVARLVKDAGELLRCVLQILGMNELKAISSYHFFDGIACDTLDRGTDIGNGAIEGDERDDISSAFDEDTQPPFALPG